MNRQTETPTFPDDFDLARYYLFDRVSEGLGAKVAVRFGARSFTYDDVAARARAFSALLADADVRRGERVLLVLTDAPPFVWSFFGTLHRGAVVAMGNPHAAAEQIVYLAKYTRATAVVTHPEVATVLAEAKAKGELAELRAIFVTNEVATGEDCETEAQGDDLAKARYGSAGDVRVDLAARLRAARGKDGGLPLHRDEPAIWLFTSGSTGEPKANVHSHRDFAWNTEVYAKRTVGYRASDVTLSVPRLFFGYATGTNLMFPFAVGGTTALFSERPTPESLVAALAWSKPTIVTNVPTMLGKLLDHDESERREGRPGLDLSSVRFSLSAGEALPESLLRRWLDRMKSEVYDGIGSAEMFHIYASNRPGDVKPGSLGRVVAGYELRVLPEEAEGPGATPCAPGDIGVLWVKGDSVSHGYWLDRDKSFRTFHGHWCRTGDLFTIDADGYLYFAGRADELIKVSGLWVSPLEVEECLMRHPEVSMAAVIGVMDEGLVKPKAFVVLRGGASRGSSGLAAELQAHVKGSLSKHKYPRFVEFVDDLPKNDRGKVDRKGLRALEASRGGAS
ncbi:MAG: benzoate-CoA ligase family protein [Polyangiaceae bacterium]